MRQPIISDYYTKLTDVFGDTYTIPTKKIKPLNIKNFKEELVDSGVPQISLKDLHNNGSIELNSDSLNMTIHNGLPCIVTMETTDTSSGSSTTSEFECFCINDNIHIGSDTSNVYQDAYKEAYYYHGFQYPYDDESYTEFPVFVDLTFISNTRCVINYHLNNSSDYTYTIKSIKFKYAYDTHPPIPLRYDIASSLQQSHSCYIRSKYDALPLLTLAATDNYLAIIRGIKDNSMRQASSPYKASIYSKDYIWSHSNSIISSDSYSPPDKFYNTCLSVTTDETFIFAPNSGLSISSRKYGAWLGTGEYINYYYVGSTDKNTLFGINSKEFCYLSNTSSRLRYIDLSSAYPNLSVIYPRCYVPKAAGCFISRESSDNSSPSQHTLILPDYNNKYSTLNLGDSSAYRAFANFIEVESNCTGELLSGVPYICTLVADSDYPYSGNVTIGLQYISHSSSYYLVNHCSMSVTTAWPSTAGKIIQVGNKDVLFILGNDQRELYYIDAPDLSRSIFHKLTLDPDSSYGCPRLPIRATFNIQCEDTTYSIQFIVAIGKYLYCFMATYKWITLILDADIACIQKINGSLFIITSKKLFKIKLDSTIMATKLTDGSGLIIGETITFPKKLTGNVGLYYSHGIYLIADNDSSKIYFSRTGTTWYYFDQEEVPVLLNITCFNGVWLIGTTLDNIQIYPDLMQHKCLIPMALIKKDLPQFYGYSYSPNTSYNLPSLSVYQNTNLQLNKVGG